MLLTLLPNFALLAIRLSLHFYNCNCSQKDNFGNFRFEQNCFHSTIKIASPCAEYLYFGSLLVGGTTRQSSCSGVLLVCRRYLLLATQR